MVGEEVFGVVEIKEIKEKLYVECNSCCAAHSVISKTDPRPMVRVVSGWGLFDLENTFQTLLHRSSVKQCLWQDVIAVRFPGDTSSTCVWPVSLLSPITHWIDSSAEQGRERDWSRYCVYALTLVNTHVYCPDIVHANIRFSRDTSICIQPNISFFVCLYVYTVSLYKYILRLSFWEAL